MYMKYCEISVQNQSVRTKGSSYDVSRVKNIFIFLQIEAQRDRK